MALSPFTAADGSLYVAHKASRVIAVHARTGALQHHYAVVADAPAETPAASPSPSSDPDLKAWRASPAGSAASEGHQGPGQPASAEGGSKQSGGRGAGWLLVGRTEYTVVCYERGGGLRWNMTYAEYAHPTASPAVMDMMFYHVQVSYRI